MKIIYCLPQLYMPGGIERICSIKANYLADVMHYDVKIVVSQQDNLPPYYELSPNVRMVDLNIQYSQMNSMPILKRIRTKAKLQREHKRKLSEFLLKEKADIVISTLTHEVNFINDIKDGSKKLLEFHFCRGHKRKMADAFGFPILTKLAFYVQCWREEYLLIPKFDQFVVLTAEDMKYWQGRIKNVKYISNILPFEQGEQANLESKHVIAVGRFDAQKGFDRLIQIWASIADSHPDWILDIFGQGSDKHKLQHLIDELNCKTISLHDPDKNIKQRYLESSIFVMTSTYEGLPMTLLEATGLGLPSVCYDFTCGPKDVIVEGQNGFLIPEGDASSFANKLSLLMSDSQLRLQLGNNAYKLSTRYSKSTIMSQWVKLLNNIK